MEDERGVRKKVVGPSSAHVAFSLPNLRRVAASFRQFNRNDLGLSKVEMLCSCLLPHSDRAVEVAAGDQAEVVQLEADPLAALAGVARQAQPVVRQRVAQARPDRLMQVRPEQSRHR